MVVNMVSRSGRKVRWREQCWKGDAAGLENCLNRKDVRINQVVIHRPVFRHVSQSRLASSACAAALFLCGREGRHIHREYIVVNGRKAAWKPGMRTEASLSLVQLLSGILFRLFPDGIPGCLTGMPYFCILS